MYPGREARFVFVEVSELVRQHGFEFGNREEMEKRKADTHHGPAAESDETAPMPDPCADLIGHINFRRGRLPNSQSNLVHSFKKPRMLFGSDLRSARREAAQNRQE